MLNTESNTHVTTTNSLAIVILSCDKYSDLWEPFFGLFFKNWPDCRYKIYLVANHQTYADARVETIQLGEDRDWSSNILSALEMIPASHVLLFVEDAFITAKVDSTKIQDYFDMALTYNANALRLTCKPAPQKSLNKELGVLSKNSMYRVTIFATIWKVQMLKEILTPGESAWQFELEGTKRSYQFDNFFCTRKSVFSYVHGVERGVWISPSAKSIRRLGYQIDETKRAIMNWSQHLAYCYRCLKNLVFWAIPEAYRRDVMHFVRRVYKITGLR